MLNTDAYADNHLTCYKRNHLVVSPGYQAVVSIRVAAQYISRGCHWRRDVLYLSDIACGALCD